MAVLALCSSLVCLNVTVTPALTYVSALTFSLTLAGATGFSANLLSAATQGRFLSSSTLQLAGGALLRAAGGAPLRANATHGSVLGVKLGEAAIGRKREAQGSDAGLEMKAHDEQRWPCSRRG